MRQPNSKNFTYQTRVSLSFNQEPIFDAYAEHMSHVERKLFADIASGKEAHSLKSLYLKQFEITARQFNSCRSQVEGKIASFKECLKDRIASSKNRIIDLEKKIQNLRKKKADSKVIHQKKRRLSCLKQRLSRMLKDQAEGKVRLAFGSKKLFRAQFDLDSNNMSSHSEWKEAWQKARSDSFFLLGSKDEASGNQSCSATIEADGSLTLRLRLPKYLAKSYGTYITMSNVYFSYGYEHVIAALKSCEQRKLLLKEKNPQASQYGSPLSYRFKRDKKGWRLLVMVSCEEPKWITRKELGAIGIDCNATHLAVTETDRFGNLLQHRAIPLDCYGKSSTQIRAKLGDAAKEIIDWAIRSQKPIVLEKLDFRNKKATLKESSCPKQARMLSSFAYKAMYQTITSRGFRNGVEVQEVHPAFTSVIGQVKFAKRYGISIHESAALCIARRFQNVSERLSCHQAEIPDGKGGHVALSLPVRNRDEHVWVSYRIVRKRLIAVHAAQVLARNRSSKSVNTHSL